MPAFFRLLGLLLPTAAGQAALCLKAPSHYFPDHTFHSIFWLVVSFDLVLWAIYTVQIYPRFISPLRKLPGPKGGYPVIGHELIRFMKPMGAEYLKLMDEIPNDGLIRYRGFLNRDIVFLTSPAALADVLVKRPYDFQKPDGIRSFVRRFLGDGLVIVEGDVHKFQRKRIMPSFSLRNIKELYPVFWNRALMATAAITEEVLKDPSGNCITDVNYWSTKVTLDIIGIAGLGREFNSLQNKNDILTQNYEEILEPTIGKLIMFALTMYEMSWFNKFIPGKVEKRFLEACDSLRESCIKFLDDKREKKRLSEGQSTDILSKLMDSNDFSDNELVDQLLTFIAVGHETTSSAFTWVIYLLALNPEIQSRLREEIHANIPQTDSTNAEYDLASTLESLPLLNGVCHETLRLYPTIPLTVRTPRQTTTVAGQCIPKGTEMYIVPWAINRSQDLWGPTASEFRPERWIDSDTGKPNNTGGAKSNYSIMTFLHGPHTCIGQGFAKAELRALTAAIVGAFHIELAYPDKPPIPVGLITTKPEDGMWVKLKQV